jgi:zinc transporter ZupT
MFGWTQLAAEQGEPTLLQSIPVVALPSSLMLFGSAVAFSQRIPEKIQAATQNFSAGLLIAAIAGELFPLMNGQAAEGAGKSTAVSEFASTLAIGIGFVIALGFMFTLEELLEGDEHGHGDDDEEEHGHGHGETEKARPSVMEPMLSEKSSSAALAALKQDCQKMEGQLKNLNAALAGGERDTIDEVTHLLKVPIHAARRHLQGAPATVDEHNTSRMQFHAEELAENILELSTSKNVGEARRGLKVVEGTLKHIHQHAERVKFKRWEVMPVPDEKIVLSEKIEWPLVFTVTVDSAVDGLLIGLAYAAASGAGWAMSIATAIEMGFLGLSFSATIQNATSSKAKHVILVAIPPAMLMAFGMLGHILGFHLQENPLVFVSFISFAVVALLFLVTQELLAEAREVAGENKIINSMLFFGLFAGIVLSKFVG